MASQKTEEGGSDKKHILVSDELLVQACSYLNVQEIARLTGEPLPRVQHKKCQVHFNRSVSETTLRNVALRFPYIQNLSVSGPQPFNIPWFMALAAFEHITYIKFQEIDNWPTHEDKLLAYGMQILADVWGNTLETLDLRRCTCLTDEHLATMLFKVPSGWVETMSLDTEQVQVIPEVRFPHLKTLILSDCVALSYTAWCIIALQANVSSLHTVHVPGCHSIFDYKSPAVGLMTYKTMDKRSSNIKDEWLHISQHVFTNLTDLNISHNVGVTDGLIKDWFNSTSFSPKLTQLDVSFCPYVTKRSLQEIGTMEGLRTLNLAGCSRMCLKDLPRIYSLMTLSSLSLSEHEPIVNSHPTLRNMHPVHAEHDTESFETVKDEELMRTITALGDKPLAGLMDAMGSQLTSLMLQYCNEVVVDALGKCMIEGALGHVQRLNLSHSILPASGNICEGIGNLLNLNVLIINDMSGPGCRSNSWALLGKSRALEHLYIQRCEYFDEDTLTCMFEGYAEKGNWKTLDARGCPGVTDRVIVSILNQLHTGHLQYFDISDCKNVTEYGLIALLSAEGPLDALHTFGFDFTRSVITDKRL